MPSPEGQQQNPELGSHHQHTAVALQGPAGAALQVEPGLEGLYGWRGGEGRGERGKKKCWCD